MQFLMGLGDEYDNVKNQILLMDTFPSINKAYSMILSVEKQREVNTLNVESSENSTILLARRNYNENYNSLGAIGNRRPYYNQKEDKRDKYCSKCKINGHTIDNCFKIHGYPDWFIELQKKKGANMTGIKTANAVHMDDTPLQQQQPSPLQQQTDYQMEPINADIRSVHFAGFTD
ncbi:uncharacterized protein LOC119370139 [Jatropha curcas]|uniref:uncharacterized protein LOC119370139 n=1 Tax=Jatropha curcas TaxID=180498 RepID=UPI001893B590|nr:uncharacterized protein LOC119370139 [Jatropha curcas]